MNIGLFFGNIVSVMRTSLADFDFGSSEYLTDSENKMYWFVWFLIVLMTCIIFLNFIIAEASSSYD